MRNRDKANFHKLQEPQIFDESACFMTKIFFIRYADEQVLIRDIVKFRTEVDVQPNYLQTEFFLKVEMFYCPPPSDNFQVAVNSAEVMKEEMKKSVEKFKLVQTKVFQINNLMQGLSTYVPVNFDREFTSICACTIHGCIIDYRFRV